MKLIVGGRSLWLSLLLIGWIALATAKFFESSRSESWAHEAARRESQRSKKTSSSYSSTKSSSAAARRDTETRPLVCGMTSVGANFGGRLNRVFRGRDALPGEFPYHVAILTMFQNGRISQCTGSIIGHSVVLTAASCITSCESSPSCIMVLPGHRSYDFKGSNMTFVANNVRFVIAQRYHDKWDKCAYSNPNKGWQGDIALLRVDQPMKFELTKDGLNSVNSICLPAENLTISANEIVSLAGLSHKGSADGDELGDIKPNIQTTNMLTMDFDECMSELKIKEPNEFCRDEVLCLRSQPYGGTACRNDHGGAGEMLFNGRSYAVGIASDIGTKCNVDKPVIYTRVSYHLAWIEKVLKEFAELDNKPLPYARSFFDHFLFGSIS